MNARDKAEDLLRQFGEALGVDGVGLDGEGTAVVTFDGLFVLFGVSEADALLRITTALPDSEGSKPARLLEDLLIANAHGGAADGATIAIDGPSGPVIVQRQLSLADLRYHEFEAVLGSFVGAASALAARVQLARAEFAHSEDADPRESVGDMFMIRA